MRVARTSFYLSLFLFLFPSLAALAVELKVWTPRADGPKLILPVPDGGDAEEAAARYLLKLFASKELASAVKSEWITTTKGTFTDFSPSRAEPLFALLDNSFEDGVDEVRAFERAGAETYLVPMGVELALASTQDRAEFRRVLADSVDAMVALGGADIAPSLYGEKVTFAKYFNRKRDLMELGLLKAYLRRSSKPLFGICRGHQLIGVLHGYKLIQDLDEELGATGHVSGHHPIGLVPGTVLAEILFPATTVRVNSLHHQAVDLSSNPNGDLLASAFAGEGDTEVVEAMETEDGRVLTVQFHPELMKGAVGRGILRGMVRRARGDSFARRLY